MISSINQSNSFNKNMPLKKQSNTTFSGNSNEEFSQTKNKIGAALGTVSGISLALAFLMKRKGFSLNPAKIFKTKPKDWGLWKMEFKEKEILTIGAGSILGGLTGGAISDKKENLNSKFREAVIQIGNISVPLIFVSLAAKHWNKNSEKILKHIPQIKSQSKTAEILNKGFKASPILAATGVCLVAGVFCANKLGNFINEKIFNIKCHRKMKAADFSPHIDDVCLGISLMASKDIIGHSISRFIPAALTIAGYSIGTAQEKPHIMQQRQTRKSKRTKLTSA